MERVDTDTDVESILTGGLGHVLVASNTTSLKGLRGDLKRGYRKLEFLNEGVRERVSLELMEREGNQGGVYEGLSEGWLGRRARVERVRVRDVRGGLLCL